MLRLTPLAIVLLLFITGCGDQGPTKYPASGTVYLQGQPLTHGVVMFVSDDGPAEVATIHADGTFQLDAVAGQHRVSVRPVLADNASTPELIDQDGSSSPRPGSAIPRIYQRFDTSGLEVDVTVDNTNQFDLRLP